MDFNTIEVTEKEGVGHIKINGIELKGINRYEIKRDTDIAELVVSISVPIKNLKTNKVKEG